MELPIVGAVLGPLSGTAGAAGAVLVKFVTGGGARVTAWIAFGGGGVFTTTSGGGI